MSRFLISTTLQDHMLSLIQKHGGVRPAARALQLDPGYVSRLVCGSKSKPSKETLRKLGLVTTVNYWRKGRS